MKTDTHKTNVIFYVETDSDGMNILAYFPDLKYQDAGSPRTCYCHIGQHSGCTPEYVKNLTRANKEDYEDLKKELESIGYNLNVIN